jgi:hypothetical protein
MLSEGNALTILVLTEGNPKEKALTYPFGEFLSITKHPLARRLSALLHVTAFMRPS